MSKHEVFAKIDPATGEETYPYAIVFTLFLVGKHELALNYAQTHTSPAFRDMYKEYVEKYNCEGFPEYQISQRYQKTMQEMQGDATDF